MPSVGTLRASAVANELISLANKKGAMWWKWAGMIFLGRLSVRRGKPPKQLKRYLADYRLALPSSLSILASAYGEVGQLDDVMALGRRSLYGGGDYCKDMGNAVYRTAGELF